MFVDHLIQYRISPRPKTAEKRGFCTGVTDQRTDGPTDRPSYRDAFLTDASKKGGKTFHLFPPSFDVGMLLHNFPFLHYSLFPVFSRGQATLHLAVSVGLSVHPLVCLSVSTSQKVGKRAFQKLFVYVSVLEGGLGGALGVDGGWLPLPTRPQRYCDPASLVLPSFPQMTSS